jgi:hypothetical protein
MFSMFIMNLSWLPQEENDITSFIQNFVEKLVDFLSFTVQVQYITYCRV